MVCIQYNLWSIFLFIFVIRLCKYLENYCNYIHSKKIVQKSKIKIFSSSFLNNFTTSLKIPLNICTIDFTISSIYRTKANILSLTVSDTWAPGWRLFSRPEKKKSSRLLTKKKKKKINSTLEPGAHSAGDRAIDCHAQIHVVTVHVFSFDMYNEHEPHVTVALTRLKCLRRRHRVRATFPTTAYPHHHLRLSRRQPYPPFPLSTSRQRFP